MQIICSKGMQLPKAQIEVQIRDGCQESKLFYRTDKIEKKLGEEERGQIFKILLGYHVNIFFYAEHIKFCNRRTAARWLLSVRIKTVLQFKL